MEWIVEQLNMMGRVFVGLAVPMLPQSALLIGVVLLVENVLRTRVRASLRYWLVTCVLAYLVLTLCYSFFLKRIPLVDVLVIATLFTLRIVAGMALAGTPPSHWLLMFSVFFFFSLALMKREVELGVMEPTGATVLQGRGYALEDRTLLMCFGASSGVASLVVFALFISSMIEDHAATTYASPQWLWGALFVLSYWVMRMWLLTARGQMNDDPILYAARDRASLILGALTAVFVLAAQLVPV